MKEIIVKNQAELDAVPEDFDGWIVIAAENETLTVRRRYRNSVVAWDNSSVVAWGNSSVVARENSSVVAWDNSSVEARDNSSVVAWDNSSVVAMGNGRIKAAGNAQVLDFNRKNNIEICGNARIVYNPSTIEEWANFSGIEIKNGKILLYKAVHKIGGRYISDFDKNFQYKVGVDVESKGFCSDPNKDCGNGIHLSTIQWAADYGRRWDDIAILELEADAAEIVVPLYETGKVRAPRAKVIREVPLEEAGVMGEIIKRARKK